MNEHGISTEFNPEDNMYAVGLKALMAKEKVGLDEATRMFKEEVQETGPEHLPQIDKVRTLLKKKAGSKK